MYGISEEKFYPRAVDDLLKGSHDWKDIPEVIKLAFIGLTDVVRVQGSALHEFERQLSNKLSRVDFLSELCKKPDSSFLLDSLSELKREYRSIASEINTRLSNKLDAENFQQFLNEKLGKEQFEFYSVSAKQDLQRFREEITGKFERLATDKDRLDEDLKKIGFDVKVKVSLVEVEEKLDTLNQKLSSDVLVLQEAQRRELTEKVDREKFLALKEGFKDMESILENLQKEVEDVRESNSKNLLDKVESRDYQRFVETTDMKIEGLKEIQSKLSMNIECIKERDSVLEKNQFRQFSEFQQTHEYFKATNEKVHLKIESFSNLIQNTVSDLEKIKSNMDELNATKANLVELSSKADFNAVAQELSKKIDDSVFYDTFHQLKSLIQEKASAFTLAELNKTVEKFQKDLILKANIKDICILLDTKATIDDINTVLSELHTEIDQKLEKTEYNSNLSKQTTINSSLIAGNTSGRWQWLSGSTLKTGCIPWERQLLNTQPENFMWEENSGFILVTKGGYYELIVGIFSPKKSTFQVLINGEVAISALNHSNFAPTGNGGRLRAPSITGVSLQEFLNLPNRARLSITCDQGEGFLSLRKL